MHEGIHQSGIPDRSMDRWIRDVHDTHFGGGQYN